MTLSGSGTTHPDLQESARLGDEVATLLTSSLIG